MIFEVPYMTIKNAITSIYNTLTETELKKKEFAHIELHVEEERVFISCLAEESAFAYQWILPDAEPIFEGNMTVNIQYMVDALKSFGKDSGILMFELDGNTLRIDDGVLEPEIISLKENYLLEQGFSLDAPNESFLINRESFFDRLELAKINTTTTFLPATSYIHSSLEGDELVIRSFSFSNLYEGKIKINSTSLHNFSILLDKGTAARLSRLLKTLKNKTLQLYANEQALFVFSSEFTFRFPSQLDNESVQLFRSLCVPAFRKSIASHSVSLNEWKKQMKIPKGADIPETWVIQVLNGKVQWEEEKGHHEEVISYAYPFKVVRKIIQKWTGELEISVGTKENQFPLLFVNETELLTDCFVVMGCMEQVVLNDSEVGRFEEVA